MRWLCIENLIKYYKYNICTIKIEFIDYKNLGVDTRFVLLGVAEAKIWAKIEF